MATSVVPIPVRPARRIDRRFPLGVTTNIMSFLPVDDASRAARTSVVFNAAVNAPRGPWHVERNLVRRLVGERALMAHAATASRRMAEIGDIQTVVTITGRSLLLDRATGIPTNYARLDTYMSELGISVEDLVAWNGFRILDAGSGLGMFASEAQVLFNIRVDRIDLNERALRRSYMDVAGRYSRAMSTLMELERQSAGSATRHAGYNAPAIIGRMADDPATVVQHFLRSATENPIRRLNLSDLGGAIARDTYDVVISSWVFMYMTAEVQELAIRELVRVTKVGGEIRILPGNTLARRHVITERNIREWGNAHEKKLTVVGRFERERLMILRVEANPSCCVIL